MPETSIIVRTFNEEAHVGRLLAAIREQRYHDFEIINVDSGSVDMTRSITAQYCDRVIGINSRDFTFGFSLNEGVRNSSGRYLVCVSAHTAPVDGDWLERLVAPLASDRTAMVYGRQIGDPALSKYSEIQDMRRIFGTKPSMLTPPNFFANNANASVRRDLWEQHPFDETLAGLEDAEFARHWMEQGYQVVYEPTAAIYHIHQETWRQVRRRYYREAVAAKAMRLKDRSHILGEVTRELRWFAADLVHAAKDLKLPGAIAGITLFRYNKALGTFKGLRNGEATTSPEQRDALFFDRTAKAVVVRGAGHASLEEVPVPQVKPGDVLIKVAYVGVCHTDLEVLSGQLGYYKSGLAHYPIVPGHEYSGRVVDVGPNVTHLAEGDAVVAETLHGCGECAACESDNAAACASRAEVGVLGHDGAYAEYVVLPGRFVHKLEPGADLLKASLVEPLSVVMRGLRRVSNLLTQPRRVAVAGAGPIGHLTALVLRHQGHEVTAIEPHAERRSLLERLGVTTAEAFPTNAAFDLIVEATGNHQALTSVLQGSRPQSTVLLLGMAYGAHEFNFEQVVADEKTIAGSVGASAVDVDAAIAILPHLDLSVLTTHVMPLARYADAWDVARTRAQLKTVLEVDPLLNAEPTQVRAQAGLGTRE